MNNVLPSDFTLCRFGLTVRFVNENDVPFILELRTNAKLSRYLHPTENNISKQLIWVKNYKIREAKGQDYYFIFFKEGAPIGLSRIYDIHDTWATGGSWICRPGLTPDISIATNIITREIIFDVLSVGEERFDVRKANKQVIKLHKMLGAEIIGETDMDYLFCLKKEVFKANVIKLIRLLEIK